jgi:pSer/pThr/pTyr-binding forkhead associated (FHA) protein
VIEVRERNVNLKDLDSTNGTFFEGERARAVLLKEGAMFRIGSSLIRVTLRPK